MSPLTHSIKLSSNMYRFLYAVNKVKGASKASPVTKTINMSPLVDFDNLLFIIGFTGNI